MLLCFQITKSRLEWQWSSLKIAGMVKYQCLRWQCCSASSTNLCKTSNLTEIHSVNMKSPELRLQVTLPPPCMRLHQGMTSLQKVLLRFGLSAVPLIIIFPLEDNNNNNSTVNTNISDAEQK